MRRHLEGEVGRLRRVLTESESTGRTEHFTPVRLSEPRLAGQVLDLRMAGHDGRHLIAA